MGLPELVHKLLRRSTRNQHGEDLHLPTEVSPLPKPTSVETTAYGLSTAKSPGDIPEYVVRGLLSHDETYICDTPLEEPQDSQARGRVGFYNGKHVIGRAQLRLRVRELFDSPLLKVVLTHSTEGQKILSALEKRFEENSYAYLIQPNRGTFDGGLISMWVAESSERIYVPTTTSIRETPVPIEMVKKLMGEYRYFGAETGCMLPVSTDGIRFDPLREPEKAFSSN